MFMSLLSAFILPARITSRVPASVANIFRPVASPTHAIAGWVHNKFAARRPRDGESPDQPRVPGEVFLENTELRILVASLKGQLFQAQERLAERAKVGEVLPFCTPFSVVAGDSAGRDSLMLAGSSFDGVAEDQAVLYSGGIAGRISRAGIGEARVRLVTDPNFTAEVSFARFVYVDGKPDLQQLSQEKKVVRGLGNGKLATRVDTKFKDETHLTAGDWATLNDGEWAPVIRGYRVAQVSEVVPAKEAGWFNVTLKPNQELRRLDEVMVLNKVKG
jgi:hypothetical protein